MLKYSKAQLGMPSSFFRRPSLPSRPPLTLCRADTAPKNRTIPADFMPSSRQEDDPRFCRVDVGTPLAAEARRNFVAQVARGPLKISLAEAALWVAAEDDALVTNSPVCLPVAAYLQRIESLANELGGVRLPALGLGPVSGGEGADRGPGEASTSGGDGAARAARAARVVAEMEKFLYEEKKFRVKRGRTGIPPGSIVDSPGVWESPASAYLNDLLTKKIGSPATAAILMSDIARRMLQGGQTDVAVRIDVRFFDDAPRPVLLPGMSRSSLALPDGSLANTCTTDALVEMLRVLKRSFWPFRWDTALDAETEYSGGGFLDAASRILKDKGSATEAGLDAIGRSAAYRLERGIFTSTGSGDLRRALAACERLALLCGDERPWERRDLAILLVHHGAFSHALAELRAYAATPHSRTSQSSMEREAVAELLARLPALQAAAAAAEAEAGSGGEAKAGAEAAEAAPLSVARPDRSVLFGEGAERRRKKISIHW